MTDPERARALRRRHMHERQAVIFGVLLAALAVIGLAAAAVYTGSLDLPFVAKEFEAEPTPTPVVEAFPCPPEGAMPVAYGKVSVDVYNGTTTSGLAASTATALEQRGFTVGQTGNKVAYDGVALITFGKDGVAQAYTLLAQIDGAVLALRAQEGAGVQVTLGSQFVALTEPDQVALNPEEPLVAPDGCTPYAEIVSPSATPSATKAS